MVTNSLDSVNIADSLNAVVEGQKSTLGLSQNIAAAYYLLLYIPIEYLSRSIRNDLLRRALAADVLAASHEAASDAHGSLYFREFLRRLFVFMGTAEHPVSRNTIGRMQGLIRIAQAIGPYLAFLLQRSSMNISSATLSMTSELVRMHLV